MKILLINAHFSINLGGSEIQCHQIASELVKRGFDLIYVAVGGYSCSSNDLEYRIVSSSINSKSIISIILEHKPDLIYWRFNKKLFAHVRQNKIASKIKTVFSVSHVHDLQPYAFKSINGLNLINTFKRKFSHLIRGYQYSKAIKSVDGIICNNHDHLELIKHQNKCYIPNSPFTDFDEFKWNKKYVVWVGNLKRHKHPEYFMELASVLQKLEVDFLMVGEIQQDQYNYVKNPDNTPSNFHYLGAQNILKTNGIIKESLMLVHTCEPEGFPNVFLQAWSYAKPVVSLFFDPENVLINNNSGMLSITFDQMCQDVSSLIKSDDKRVEMGQNANDYVKKHFVKDNNIDLLINFFHKVLGSKHMQI